MFILGLLFCKLRSSEGRGMDIELKARTSFAKAYLWIAVVLNGICMIASYVVNVIRLTTDFCDDADCGGFIYAYSF